MQKDERDTQRDSARERESRDEVTREEGGLLTRGKDSRANAWQDQVKRGRIAGEAHECAEARPTA